MFSHGQYLQSVKVQLTTYRVHVKVSGIADQTESRDHQDGYRGIPEARYILPCHRLYVICPHYNHEALHRT